MPRKPSDAALRIAVSGVTRRFGAKVALDGLDVRVPTGSIHALLGPNGAGKTTFLRMLSGLLAPSSGTVELCGLDPARQAAELRRRVGIVPAGDRTFYLRISALENLLFFARLHGLGKRQARARALEVLEQVGLAEEARAPRVGLFSHGMQKRLSVARAFLVEPEVLLVDEATHDLDPEGARRVRALVTGTAGTGTSVVWATQRLDELRGFAGDVTLLDRGRVRFQGSVEDLADQAVPRRYVIRLRNGGAPGSDVERRLRTALAGLAHVSSLGADTTEHYRLLVEEGAQLGGVMSAIARERLDLLACRSEGSELEEAFLALTGERA